MKFNYLLLLLVLLASCKSSDLKESEGDLYKILNVFLDKQVGQKFYLNKRSLCCGFVDDNNSIGLKRRYRRILKNHSFILNTNVDLFKEILNYNDTIIEKRIVIDFSRIKNKLVVPHSPEYDIYIREHLNQVRKKIAGAKMDEKQINKVIEFPDAYISGIFYSKNKEYAILDYWIRHEAGKKEDKIMILKKENRKWVELKTIKEKNSLEMMLEEDK